MFYSIPEKIHKIVSDGSPLCWIFSLYANFFPLMLNIFPCWNWFKMGVNRSIVVPSLLSLMEFDAFCMLKRTVMTLKIDYPQKASAIPFIKNRQDCSWTPEVLKVLSIYAPEILLSGLLGIRMSYLTSGTGTRISAFRYFSFDISLGFPKWCPVVVMDFMPAVSQWIFYSTTSTDCLGLKVRHVIPNQLLCSKLQTIIEQVWTQNICIDSRDEVNHLP